MPQVRRSRRPSGSSTPAARWSGPDRAVPTILAAKPSAASRILVSAPGRSHAPVCASSKIFSVWAIRVAAAASICSMSFFLSPRHSGPSLRQASTTARTARRAAYPWRSPPARASRPRGQRARKPSSRLHTGSRGSKARCASSCHRLIGIKPRFQDKNRFSRKSCHFSDIHPFPDIFSFYVLQRGE